MEEARGENECGEHDIRPPVGSLDPSLSKSQCVSGFREDGVYIWREWRTTADSQAECVSSGVVQHIGLRVRIWGEPRLHPQCRLTGTGGLTVAHGLASDTSGNADTCHSGVGLALLAIAVHIAASLCLDALPRAQSCSDLSGGELTHHCCLTVLFGRDPVKMGALCEEPAWGTVGAHKRPITFCLWQIDIAEFFVDRTGQRSDVVVTAQTWCTRSLVRGDVRAVGVARTAHSLKLRPKSDKVLADVGCVQQRFTKRACALGVLV